MKKEIRHQQQRLEELESLATSCTTKITGMPHGTGINDKISKYAAQIADLKGFLDLNLKKCFYEFSRINRFIASVHFRNSQSWQNKRKKIRERDNYLCQVCIRNLYNTERKYNYEKLQVHHAVPLNTDKTLKLDDSNLITLCKYHHYLCDHGAIPYTEVKKL